MCGFVFLKLGYAKLGSLCDGLRSDVFSAGFKEDA
jgi:hypothetical protein